MSPSLSDTRVQGEACWHFTACYQYPNSVVVKCLSMAAPRRSVHEIDSFITRSQHLLSALPRLHPRRAACVYSLARVRFNRYMLSSQKADLDKAILHLSETMLLHPWSLPELKQNIFPIFFNLAFALFVRSNEFNQPEDATYAAKYLRHLRDRPHAAFGSRHAVTTLLVDVLAVRVALEAGSVLQDIEEMALLCHELLTSDACDSADTTRRIALFAVAVSKKIRPWVLDQPLDQVIESLRAAKKHKPDLREALFALAHCLICRYYMTFVNGDYDEAASVLDEIITSGSPEDKFVTGAQAYVTTIAMVRSDMYQTPEHSEEAIYRARAFLSSSSHEKILRSVINSALKDSANRRSRFFGSIEDPGARFGDSQYSLSESQLLAVMGIYGTRDDNSEFKRTFGRIGKKNELLEGLLSRIRNNDMTKIDKAIEEARSILPSSAPTDPYATHHCKLFGCVLFDVFERTRKIKYLNESISTLRRVFEHPLPQYRRFEALGLLSRSLLTRSGSFPGYRTQDLDEGLELLSRCVDDRQASLPRRLQFACLWAHIARVTRRPSASTAYETSMLLIQETLIFAPTLQLQHAALASSDESHRISLDYASHRLDLGQLEEAIETLERGRALLWSEMRHLRASIDQLLQVHPHLAHKFARVNRDLEELTKSIPPSHELSIDDGTADDLRAVDPFSRFLLKQRKLLKERDELISQIQELPGFNNFLTCHSFDTLRSAASSGPVIIINHSKWRSDILILLQNASPSLIPTPHDFYHRARALKDKLLDSRHKYGLDSSHYDQALASVLAELYKLVGKPVIDRLRQLGVPEQSRIWWCPTSVFCSLPLHAMGPIPSDDAEKRYFLDLYICSYTPTLSALIQSRNRILGSRSSERPSVLLVAQPDPTLPTVKGEIQVVRDLQDNTNTEVISLISEAATPAAVIDGFRHHQFVHFACHGTLEAGKPFEAGFELYGDERLTLLEIVRSHLPTAEFAFLSACHTAEVTEGSLDDEILHLAAAVQYCGFRSVIGTMWAMVDEDGRDLAEHFYKTLFSSSRRVPYYERSAKALRVAVKKLRKKRRVTLERWVNFVHYGA
ncbi:CHAT domain-containing protein [Lactarius akahatsu]|uniref:CHAT domain-containing protein n=1 Tax=Lactarius akahatsu TaxID=416441 RepID=A0AAD4LJH9_9AGAM|nr:CHAT domain-containing protein [Lactarius akahatsu]